MPSTRQRRVQYSQNFLHSRRLVAKLVERSSIDRHDVVVEIGPGKGIITDVLGERAQHVIVVEKDPHHAGIVRGRFEDRPNVTVFACDFLDFPLPESSYKVFANIPYRLTSAIVGRLTSGIAPPDDSYLTMQREAAERFIGGSMVSARLMPWFSISVVHQFHRRDFVPKPAVESVLLRIERRSAPDLTWELRERYGQMVESLYSAWRPTVEEALWTVVATGDRHRLRNAIGSNLRVRPSAMEDGAWIQVFKALEALEDARVWQAVARASEELRKHQERLDRPTRTRSRAKRHS